MSKKPDPEVLAAKAELDAHLDKWTARELLGWLSKWMDRVDHDILLVLLRTVPTELLDRELINRHLGVSSDETVVSKNVSPKKTSEPQRTAIAKASTLISQAENQILQAAKEGRIQDEPAFSNRLASAIETKFKDKRWKGIKWDSLTLTSNQPNAQESEFGADLLCVLDVHLPLYVVKKGFLAQAKIDTDRKPLVKSEFERMQMQCLDMSKHTENAVVFLYQDSRIVVYPALSILRLRKKEDIKELPSKTFREFFEDHFKCFFGDYELNASNKQTLDSLRKRVAAKKALILKGTPIDINISL